MANLKKVLLILLILMMANSTNSQQEINKFPKLYPGREMKVLTKHIALYLKFDWQKKQAYGSASIKVQPGISCDYFTP